MQLSNGFTVEDCETIKPSTDNDKAEINTNVLGKNNAKNKRKRKNKKNKNKNKVGETVKDVTDTKLKLKKEINQAKNKKSKPKLGENVSDVVTDLTPEDMLTWAEFKLQEPIMKALTELGFKKPTKIQEMTLPAAIHGK